MAQLSDVSPDLLAQGRREMEAVGYQFEADGRIFQVSGGKKTYIPPWVAWQSTSVGRTSDGLGLTDLGRALRTPGSDPSSVWRFMYSEGGPFTNRSKWDDQKGTYEGSIDWATLLGTIGAGGLIGAGLAAAAGGGVAAGSTGAGGAGTSGATGGTLATVGTGGAIPASVGAAGTGIGFVPAGASAGVSGLTGAAGASAGASSAIAGRSLLGTILSGAIPTAADLIAAKIQSDAINRSTDISASTAKEALDYLKAQKAKHEAAWQPFADLSAQALAHPPAARPDAGPPPAPFTGYPGTGSGTSPGPGPGPNTLATLGAPPPGPPRMPIGWQGPSVGAPMPGPGQPPSGQQGGELVLLEAPDGTRQQVPAAMVQALVARGARQVSP